MQQTDFWSYVYFISYTISIVLLSVTNDIFFLISDE